MTVFTILKSATARTEHPTCSLELHHKYQSNHQLNEKKLCCFHNYSEAGVKTPAWIEEICDSLKRIVLPI